ncbi:MAG: hypothetical protein ACK4WK_08475 [Anaerolineae bacterium]
MARVRVAAGVLGITGGARESSVAGKEHTLVTGMRHQARQPSKNGRRASLYLILSRPAISRGRALALTGDSMAADPTCFIGT